MQVEGTSLTPKKRFRVGGITYYYRLGKLQACPSKRITLKKKIRKDENGNIIPDRTPKQRKNNTKFTFARYMFAFIRKRFGDLPVWKIAAAQRGMTDDNLIQSTNYKYLDEKGKILDMEGFQVSLGPLALPLNLRATRNGTLVSITWDDPRFTLEKETGATRRDGKCEIILRDDDGEVCIHPFFARADNTAFSEDKAITLPDTE